jgi:hypothetical protein
MLEKTMDFGCLKKNENFFSHEFLIDEQKSGI